MAGGSKGDDGGSRKEKTLRLAERCCRYCIALMSLAIQKTEKETTLFGLCPSLQKSRPVCAVKNLGLETPVTSLWGDVTSNAKSDALQGPSAGLVYKQIIIPTSEGSLSALQPIMAPPKNALHANFGVDYVITYRFHDTSK